MAETSAVQVPDIVPAIWWVFMIQGILAIIFGAALFFWTPMFADLAAYIAGAFIILYSISTVIRGIWGTGTKTHRAGLTILGVLGIILGIFAVAHVYILWGTLGILIAVWAFLAGYGDLWVALTASGNKWFRAFLFITGILTLLLGFIFALFPALALLVVVQVLGIFLIAIGIVHIVNGFYIQAIAKA
jgi:uncharacterized membrane protein HdeD (DUF308 family)